MNHFRPASTSDQASLKKLFVQIRESVSYPAMFNWPDQLIEQELMRADFYVSEGAEGVIQAFIASRSNADFTEIMALGTTPSLARSGVMKALLSDFVQKNSNKGSQITLEVHEKNGPAISLYHQCGFKQVSRRKSYYSDGGAALVMTYSS